MSKAILTERLADLQSWRHGLSAQIAQVTDFLRTHDFLTPNTESALQECLAQVTGQRVTVALVAEVSRGKSELINGLFFADLGRRLLPSGPGKSTRCVTELRFDRDVKTCVMLLPIETRESPKKLGELLADESQWRSILFDADNADSTARALAALSETKRVTLSDAVAWGLHGEGVAIPAADSNVTLVDVPRWRHAIVNFPHALLDAGLVVIDTPGLAAFTSEPEFARDRVPNADALILVLDVTEGVTKTDLAVWKNYLVGAPGFRAREKEDLKQARLVVLNKIDNLTVDPAAEPAEANRKLLKDIDRRVRDVADLLRIDPICVIPVSARMGLLGKLEQDNDRTLKSRLYQLERSIAANLPRNRHDQLTANALSTLSNALETAQATLDNERFDTLSKLRQLAGLREKNEKLTSSVVVQTHARHDRLEGALRELKSIKNVHSKLGDELTAIVDLSTAKKEAAHARATILASRMPGAIADVVKQYFSATREKLDAAESKVQEVRDLFGNIGEHMRRDFDLDIYEVHPFATQRFHTELQKVQSKAETEFTKTSNLLVRRGAALAEQFDEVIGNRVLHIFEIANRETITWMRGLYSAVEKPLEAMRQQVLKRSVSVEKMKSAELDLAERIAEVQASLDVIKRKHTALADARERLERYIGRNEAGNAEGAA